MTIRAVLFDKDGTIVDFHRTWDLAVGAALRSTAPSDAALRHAADALQFDLETNTIGEESALIAESHISVTALIDSLLPVESFFEAVEVNGLANLAPAVGLPELFVALRQRGVTLGVVTNDFESFAEEQIASMGWSDHFEAVLGSDSGFGAKPSPGMVVGALELLGVAADEAVMVGDTTYDLDAGNGAGVTTVLVANGEEVSQAELERADLTVDRLSDLIPQLLEAGLLD